MANHYNKIIKRENPEVIESMTFNLSETSFITGVNASSIKRHIKKKLLKAVAPDVFWGRSCWEINEADIKSYHYDFLILGFHFCYLWPTATFLRNIDYIKRVKSRKAVKNSKHHR